MASSPPAPDSSSPPDEDHTSKHGSNGLGASDANIRNFALVARIMKLALPENAKIAKEAKECMQECVSEFISFITSEASEKCQQEKRKTVNGEDILFAMTSLGFENYAEALKIYLSRYRETLLANQNKPPGAGGLPAAGGASASSAGAGGPVLNNASAAQAAYNAETGAGNPNHNNANMMGDPGMDISATDPTGASAFGWPVGAGQHGANGQAE